MPWWVGALPAFGCAMHELAYEFAQHLQPELLPPGSRRLRQLWDSLFTGDMEQGNFGGGNMGQCNQTAPAGKARPTPPSPPPPPAVTVPSYYVDFATGTCCSLPLPLSLSLSLCLSLTLSVRRL